MAEKQRVSTHKKTRQGTPSTTGYARKTVEGLGMYTFISGTGSKRTSFTRHCSEAEAEKIVNALH